MGPTKFTLHPEYENFVLGETPLRVGISKEITSDLHYGYMLFLGLFTLCCCVILIGFLGYNIYQDQVFLREGQEVTAYVMDCHMVSLKGYRRPEVRYRYSVGRQTYTAQNILYGSHDCEPYTTDTPLMALYTPSNMSRIVEEGAAQSSEEVSILYILLFICVICPLACFSALSFMLVSRYTRRKYRLITNALLLEGEINHISTELRGTNRSFYVIVQYKFMSPHQKVVIGHAEAARQDLQGKDLPSIGTPVTILYADDHAHMML